jgi:hypothetical protein
MHAIVRGSLFKGVKLASPFACPASAAQLSDWTYKSKRTGALAMKVGFY